MKYKVCHANKYIKPFFRYDKTDMASQMTSGYFLNHYGFLLFITNVSFDKVIRFFQLRMINTPKENEGLTVIMKQRLDVANHKLFKTRDMLFQVCRWTLK